MMIRKDFLVAVSVLILLASPLLSVLPIAGIATGQDAEVSAPVPITTDIVVGSGDIQELDTVNYNITGNIIVENGGILYINDSIIEFNCGSHGEFELSVEKGGILHILNSNISAVDKTTATYPLSPDVNWDVFYGKGWKFPIHGAARITDSTLSYMWGDQGNTQMEIEGGVQIYNSNVTIKNTLVYNSCNAGISIMDEGFDFYSGVSPILDTVTIYNTVGFGMIVMGEDSAPKIYDSRFIGNSNTGAYFFIGVDAMVNDSIFRDNGDEGIVFHDSGAGGASSENEFHNCTIYNNAHGVSYAEGSGGVFYDTIIRNNKYSGVRDTADSTSGTSIGNFYRCDIYENGESGVNITADSSKLWFHETDIYRNEFHGADIDTASGVYFFDSDLNNNKMFGLWSNGSANPRLEDCILEGNIDGGIRATNGSLPRLIDTDLIGSRYGILALDSSPTFTGTLVSGNDIGIFFDGDCSPMFTSGDVEDNDIGIFVKADGVDVHNQTISGSSVAGVVLRDSDGAKVRSCDLSNNDVGIRITGGDHTRIADTNVGGSATGFELSSGANITVRGCDVTSNSKDFELDGGSIARAYSLGTTTSDVTMVDDTSEFWHYWSISLMVYDNVTFAPVTLATMAAYSNAGDLLTEELTFFDGSVKGDAAQYNLKGSTYTDLTPLNLTVSKDGYVPYINQDHAHTGDFSDSVWIAENKAPSLPFPINNAPKQTHNNRPKITWDPPYDWNMDDIDYKVTIWQDEMGTGPVIVDGEIVGEPFYNFTRNLRYNHEFWVEVFAFDPWGEPYGLSDVATFSFRTYNNPPSRPEVAFAESPVPSLQDIEVVILNASADMDTNPVDDISYLIQWEAFREGSWGLIKSGSNAFILDQNLTREGDMIRATIKPFDGIEYGEEVVLLVDVANFAPETIIKYADIELDEDTPQAGLIDLTELFTDRDGDILSFNVKVARHINAEIDPVTNEITFIPDPNYQGNDYIILEATDSKPHTNENPTVQINVTVNGLNDEPFIVDVNDKPVEKGARSLVESTQGTNVIITVAGIDPDGPYGDTVEYSTDFLDIIGEGIVNDDEFIFEKTTGRMNIFLKNSLVGKHEFNITITDSAGLSTSTPVTLIVENRNDAPTAPEITSHTEGQEIRLEDDEKTITFSAAASDDPDLHIPDSKETLEYDWNFGDGWLENRGLEVTREFTVSGEYTVKLRVRDSMGLYEETFIKVVVNVTGIPEVPDDGGEDESFMNQYGLILILVIIAIIVIIVIVLVIVRKDDLTDTASDIEKEHEALVAKQQEDAMVAQERLQALMSGVPYPEATGPALPSAQPEGQGLEALPAAAPEPGQEPPMDQQPPQEEPSNQEQMPEQQPPMEPAPAPVPEPEMQAPPVAEPQMQAAPEPTPAPMPEQAPVQEPGMAPPAPEPEQQAPSYLPPEETTQ